MVAAGAVITSNVVVQSDRKTKETTASFASSRIASAFQRRFDEGMWDWLTKWRGRRRSDVLAEGAPTSGQKTKVSDTDTLVELLLDQRDPSPETLEKIAKALGQVDPKL